MLGKVNLSATLADTISPVPLYHRRSFLVPFCIVVVSLLLKLTIIPVVFHSDMISLAWTSRTLAIGDWDVYGAWLWLAGLLGLFPVQRWSAPDPTVLTALNIFILKLPALLADFVAAFLVSRIFEGSKRNPACGYYRL